MSGEQQRHRHPRGLDVGDALGRAQSGDDVVSGLGPLAGDQLLAVREQLTQPLFRPGAIADVGGVGGPGAELVTVLVGHAEQLADHQDRQRHRHRGLQIRGMPVLGQLVQQ
ncbi:hypothetical protein [Saccharomonospora sp. CUA-673]|uniref:hypothetical protein n=1 Tax=Saccharomonospora sp. CUA-673 TaxID=1904969 RepID=UPI003516D42C